MVLVSAVLLACARLVVLRDTPAWRQGDVQLATALRY